ncbi:MAG: hypothetical protein O6952_05020 [Planctomycetota bacterium]|nr:hypothetical protein [Planctomycetota bacterium]
MRMTILLALGLAAIGGVLFAGDVYQPIVQPANFVDSDGNPYPIDNMHWPMIPGTTLIYEGVARSGPLHDEVYVTHETKEILGVVCTVVEHLEWIWNVETSTWKLKEMTSEWHAQDSLGNVWYFGEDTVEFDDADDFDTTEGGSWEAGVDGAVPGIAMPGDPFVGLTYQMEYYENVAEDRGKILRLNAKVSTFQADFKHVLKTKEWTPLEPGAVEHKYWAPDLGLVLVTGPKGSHWFLELIGIVVE